MVDYGVLSKLNQLSRLCVGVALMKKTLTLKMVAAMFDFPSEILTLKSLGLI